MINLKRFRKRWKERLKNSNDPIFVRLRHLKASRKRRKAMRSAETAKEKFEAFLEDSRPVTEPITDIRKRNFFE